MSLVVVTDHPFRDLDTERQILGDAGHELEVADCLDADDVAEACGRAVGVLNTYAPIPAGAIEAMAECRAIARYGIGLDTIDLEAATLAGIAVSNVPDYCIEEVALHTIGLLLAGYRRIVAGDRRVRAGQWDTLALGPVRRLAGQQLGLLGMGRIPRSVARKAQALSLRVAAHDPYVDAANWPEGVERVESLEQLAEQSDFLSVHVPLTPDTRHLVGAAILEAMPPHALLVNTSRGPVVDTASLAAALVAESIAGAAVDVLEQEPPVDDPLITLENVIVTPHASFYSEESMREQQRKAAENLRDALSGERPTYLANPTVMA